VLREGRGASLRALVRARAARGDTHRWHAEHRRQCVRACASAAAAQGVPSLRFVFVEGREEMYIESSFVV